MARHVHFAAITPAGRDVVIKGDPTMPPEQLRPLLEAFDIIFVALEAAEAQQRDQAPAVEAQQAGHAD